MSGKSRMGMGVSGLASAWVRHGRTIPLSALGLAWQPSFLCCLLAQVLSCFLNMLGAKLEAVIPATEGNLRASTVPVYLAATDLRGPWHFFLAAREVLTLLHTKQLKIKNLAIEHS